jgi:hypothetical protein
MALQDRGEELPVPAAHVHHATGRGKVVASCKLQADDVGEAAEAAVEHLRRRGIALEVSVVIAPPSSTRALWPLRTLSISLPHLGQ